MVALTATIWRQPQPAYEALVIKGFLSCAATNLRLIAQMYYGIVIRPVCSCGLLTDQLTDDSEKWHGSPVSNKYKIGNDLKLIQYFLKEVVAPITNLVVSTYGKK